MVRIQETELIPNNNFIWFEGLFYSSIKKDKKRYLQIQNVDKQIMYYV